MMLTTHWLQDLAIICLMPIVLVFFGGMVFFSGIFEFLFCLIKREPISAERTMTRITVWLG